MKVYLVRAKGTSKLQGVFWANTQQDLWDAVDEMGEPAAMEFAPMNTPGGLWHDLSIDDTPELLGSETEDAVEAYFSTMVFENSGELFPWRADDQATLKWKPFDYADEGAGLIRRVVDGSV